MKTMIVMTRKRRHYFVLYIFKANRTFFVVCIFVLRTHVIMFTLPSASLSCRTCYSFTTWH